jgi:hypothetical protein
MYRRQIFKQSLLKTTTEKENQIRYFGAINSRVREDAVVRR